MYAVFKYTTQITPPILQPQEWMDRFMTLQLHPMMEGAMPLPHFSSKMEEVMPLVIPHALVMTSHTE